MKFLLDQSVERRLAAFLRNKGHDVKVLCFVTTFATAQTMTGTVTKIDDKGMATVKTEDGKEHMVKGEGWMVGAKVQCTTKEGTTSCKAM
jgi:hypothetical protein